MPSPRKNDRVDLFSLVKDELASSISKPNILTFRPYEPGQRACLESQKPGRYISGGNRAGKTTLEVIDALWLGTNTHPFRKRPSSWGDGAIRIRFVVVDIIKGVHGIILPEMKRWAASSMLTNGSWDDSWDERTLTLTLSNGTTIQFLTHGMELDKHGGIALHAVYFDEEPPQDVFNENMMRLIDYEGWWLVAATSVNGIGWTYDYLIEPTLNDPDNPDIDFFTLKQSDNPHLAADEIARSRYYVGQSKEEREIRQDGALLARSGLILPHFGQNLDKFVLDEPLPLAEYRGWDWYQSLDFGFNNPTAVLWHAVGPRGQIYTFAEHYASQMIPAEHAQVIKAYERDWGKQPMVRVGDPAGKQRQGNTGTSYVTEYAMQGVYINVETITNDVEVGLAKMQEYTRILDRGSGWGPEMPTWRVSPTCPNLIRELKKLRYASPESQKVAYRSNALEVIHKKDDHAPDALRYFFTLMPNLKPTVSNFPNEGRTIRFDEMLALIAEDPEAYAPTDTNTPWETEDLDPFNTSGDLVL